jgi:hypothetical protein
MYFPVRYFAARYFGGAGGSSNSPAPSSNPFEFDLLAYLSASGLAPYPGHITQQAPLPALVYTLVAETPVYYLGGGSGLTSRTYQFSAYSTSYSEVLSLEQRLRRALHGYRGTMGATRVASSTLSNVLDRYDPSVDASDDGTYMRAADYQINLLEDVPHFS